MTPTPLASMIEHGEHLFGAGDVGGALREFNRVLVADPTNVAALIDAALAHAKLAREQQAVEMLERVLAHDPTNQTAFTLLVDLLHEIKALDLLPEVFTKYGASFPGARERLPYLGDALSRTGVCRQAGSAGTGEAPGTGGFEEFVRGLSFGVLQPEQSPTLFEVVNTRLPSGAEAITERLLPLLAIPRMSTFAIGAIINQGVAAMPSGQSFVNVGVWNGFTFLSGLAGNAGKRCVGVDNFSEFGGPRDAFMPRFNALKSPSHSFYEMDYRAYFEREHEGEIGYYIYDGEHSYENQLEGLCIAEPFLAPGCIIHVDDTNWPGPRRATLDFVSGSTHEYAILFDRRTFGNKHPTLWNGLMLLQKLS